MQETAPGKQQAEVRLVVLLMLPGASMLFSLLSLPTDDEMAFFLLAMAAVAGFAGLLAGGVVLIAQLVRNNVNVQNALYFVLAWIVSVLVFVGAIMAQG